MKARLIKIQKNGETSKPVPPKKAVRTAAPVNSRAALAKAVSEKVAQRQTGATSPNDAFNALFTKREGEQ
jgi:hypothetical protein